MQTYSNSVKVTRMFLRTISHATGTAAELFKRDALALKSVILAEANEVFLYILPPIFHLCLATNDRKIDTNRTPGHRRFFLVVRTCRGRGCNHVGLDHDRL